MADIVLPQEGLLLDGFLIANYDITHAKPLFDICTRTRLDAIELHIEAPDRPYDLIVDPQIGRASCRERVWLKV